jgi:hypothetical protein
MRRTILVLWTSQTGQDIAEYSVMLAVILIIVVGTILMIDAPNRTIFARSASSIH